MAAGQQAYAAPDTEATDSLSVPGYEQLDELVIEATRPLMQTDGAKLTYNVEEDPAASTSSALEILKKVPQISIDNDGYIRLNGSTAFKVQLNGMENPMLKQYAEQLLQGVPASMIVKIEVITEPGAKEDAEGVAGIINIITERSQKKDGYSGSVSLRAENRSLTPSLNGVFKKDNFTLSAALNYQWGFAPQRGENNTITTYLPPAGSGSLQSTMGQRSKHHFVGGNLNMSWEPNPSNLFTAGADIFYIDANLYRLYGSTQSFDAAGNRQWSFRQDGKGNMTVLNVSANASFRHNFRPEGNYLVISYLYNFGKNDLWINRFYPEYENYTPSYLYQNETGLSFDRGHTVQADYANSFGTEHHLLEVGAKGIFRHNTAISDYAYGDTPDAIAIFPLQSTDILQPQNIYAGYASYTGKFAKLGVVAGLRYEHTLMGITDRLDAADSFRNRLNDWVPNAALTWNFSASSNLRLSYQMRISRPSIQQVNPYELYITPFELRKGNPDLTSERSHIVALKYSSFGRVVGGSIGVEYNLSDNAISSFTYLLPMTQGQAIVTSFANIGKKQDIALTGFMNWNIIHNMSLMLNGRLAYNKLSAPAEGFRNHGWSGNIAGNWTYNVADVNKFSAYAAWFSRSLTVQGKTTGYYYYGISASRDFLADRSLTLGVSANNFLQKRMKFKNYTATPNVIYDVTALNLQAWSVGVSLTWKFGSLSAQVKKTGVELNNDDINTSSNKGQGGGL